MRNEHSLLFQGEFRRNHSPLDAVTKERAKEQQIAEYEAFCRKLYADVLGSKDHWLSLDETFGQVTQCNFGAVDDSPKAVNEVYHLLHRLPAVPLELPDFSSLSHSPFAPNGRPGERVAWQDLLVVSHIDTNVIRIALVVALYGEDAAKTSVKDFTDGVAELLSTATRLAGSPGCSGDENAWTSWQRSSMLYFYSMACKQVNGFDDFPDRSVVLQDFYPVAGLSMRDISRRFAGKGKPSYMCGWAFELIRTTVAFMDKRLHHVKEIIRKVVKDSKAILNINEIFESSKVTLVCDRDLMAIDATELSVNTCETILVTILVCDWNLRAWTFLEAVRGRRQAYILCKNQKAVLFKEILTTVHRQGTLDIVLFLLTAPHLQSGVVRRYEHGYMSGALKSESPPAVREFMSLEGAGSMLSHREASRLGDDMVIWSLLLGDRVSSSAEAFWKDRAGSSMCANFLISSAPRLQKRGLRWAPMSPTADLVVVDQLNGARQRLLPRPCHSALDHIGKKGFSCWMLMYDFPGGMLGSEFVSSMFNVNIQPGSSRYQLNLDRIREKYLKGFLWGALLRPSVEPRFIDSFIHRYNADRTYLAVCAANKRWKPLSIKTPMNGPGEGSRKIVRGDQSHWVWRGVYEWDMTEPLPPFVMRRIKLT
ncbi:MAG: hypothetical protein Q9169_002701 [Polycauliona sp. 2 TL-2023]